MKTTKIVHLHLKNVEEADKSDFYFGSIKAIFDFVTEDALKIKYKSLTAALRGRDVYENKNCIVRVGLLQTKQQTNKRQRNE